MLQPAINLSVIDARLFNSGA